MKNFYAFSVVDYVPTLHLKDGDYYEFGKQFDGKMLTETWKSPITFGKTSDSKFIERLKGDCFWLWVTSDVPVVSENGKMVLAPLLKNEVEFLPLLCGETGLYAMNVLSVLDCLDHEKSVIKRFEDGRIMSVYTYAFREEMIGDHLIFKTKDEPNGRVFVSEKLAEFSIKHLKGFRYRSARYAGRIMPPADEQILE